MTTSPSVRRIRPLPERLINKIAAGEVVERPASVVKELVENALDAGATRIDIAIERAGTKLIGIADNGCGIPPDQVEIAFSRHATSKIAEYSDLDRIVSYGFRGEALPSIASVARVRMVTRTAESDSATEIIIEGGVVQSFKPSAGPPGTLIEVENLFFNTPARRKFLKSEATEARHIAKCATALALGRPAIGFTLTMQNRQMFTVPAGQSFADRTRALLALDSDILSAQATAGSASVHCFLAPPEQAGPNRWNLYLFVNGRVVQSPLLAHAVTVGFGELIPRGLYPAGVVLIEVEPTQVDVNVHPAKTEVRLAAERDIFEQVVRAVREASRSDASIPLLRPERGDTPRDHALQTPQTAPSPWLRGPEGDSHLSAKQLAPLYSSPASPNHEPLPLPHAEIFHSPQPEMTPTLTGPQQGIRLLGRYTDLYLLVQAGEDLFIVDQHTAHERVLYEEWLSRIDSRSAEAQQLLLPVQVELSPEQMAVLDASRSDMVSSGFHVSPFGGRMVQIEAIPAVFAQRSPERMLVKVLDDLITLTRSGHDRHKALAQSIACRAAVMAGDRINDREAEGLLERLLRCENPYSCPHGRPTFIRLSRRQLDRQFGRV